MGSSVILPAPGQPKTGPDPSFKQGSQYKTTTFSFTDIGPPSPLYVQRDEQLFFSGFSNQVGESITVTIRMLLVPVPIGGQPDRPTAESPQPLPVGSNVLQVATFTLNIPATRNGIGQAVQLTEGYLLAVTIFPTVARTRGQTFVNASLVRAGAGVNQILVVLFSDYVGFDFVEGWPNGRVIFPRESTGWVHSIQQANPAAGADFALTMATKQAVRIDSFSAILTASATVANRNVEVIVDDGANIVWRTSAAASITAGQVATLSATGTNQPTGVVTTTLTVAIPPELLLAPGWRIRTATTGIQAGDQWSAIWFNVEEWLDFI